MAIVLASSPTAPTQSLKPAMALAHGLATRRGVDLEIVVLSPATIFRRTEPAFMARTLGQTTTGAAADAADGWPTARWIHVPYVALPFQELESAAFSLGMVLMRRPRVARPRMFFGWSLCGAGFLAAAVARAMSARSVAVVEREDVDVARGQAGASRRARRRAQFSLRFADRICVHEVGLVEALARLGRCAEWVDGGIGGIEAERLARMIDLADPVAAVTP